MEVKGTTGDGSEVILTRGEVESAERAMSVPSADGIEASGGEMVIYMPWHVHQGSLTPVSYFYRPPGT